MIIFHGGCHGCTQQQRNGVDFCFDCCYFSADWKKPNLNNRPPSDADLARLAVVARRAGQSSNRSTAFLPVTDATPNPANFTAPATGAMAGKILERFTDEERKELRANLIQSINKETGWLMRLAFLFLGIVAAINPGRVTVIVGTNIARRNDTDLLFKTLGEIAKCKD